MSHNCCTDPTHGSKFLRDGQVLIQKGDKTYTLLGQEIE